MTGPNVVDGRYHLLKRLGAGGMGEVWLARSRGLAGFEKHVAVKFLHPFLIHEQEFVDMFLDEARLAARLSHPNIVQILDLGNSDQRYFIVMEYVDGISVGGLLRRLKTLKRPLPIGQVVHILAGLLAALDYAHRAETADGEPMHIVHRDVCPDNLLIARDSGVVKLTDFGVARAVGSLHVTAEGVLKGKLRRMPPEQLAGQVVDTRADVYGAGIVLYELLVGEGPFARSPNHGIVQRDYRPEVKPPSQVVPGLSPCLDALVMRAVEPNVEKRFPSARAMLTELRPLLQTFPVADQGLVELVEELNSTHSPQTLELSPRDLAVEKNSSSTVSRDRVTSADKLSGLASTPTSRIAREWPTQLLRSDTLLLGQRQESTDPSGANGELIQRKQGSLLLPGLLAVGVFACGALLLYGHYASGRQESAPAPLGTPLGTAESRRGPEPRRNDGKQGELAPPANRSAYEPAPRKAALTKESALGSLALLHKEAPAPHAAGALDSPRPRSGRKVLDGKQVVLDEPQESLSDLTPSDMLAIERARRVYMQAERELQGGKAVEAEGHYQQTLSLYPGYVAAYRGLGRAYALEGNIDLALSSFQTYVRNATRAADLKIVRQWMFKLEHAPSAQTFP